MVCSPIAPGASGSSSAVSLCCVPDVISVCISPAIVLLLQPGWGLQYPLLLLLPVLPMLLPSPVSLHPRRATQACLSVLDFQKQLFGFWCCRRSCFSITRENTEACKRRIWQLDTAWTALSVFVTPAV